MLNDSRSSMGTGQMRALGQWFPKLSSSPSELNKSSMQVGKFLSLHRVTYTRSCIDTIDSPDEHEVARNM
jgi:hypothetical protein